MRPIHYSETRRYNQVLYVGDELHFVSACHRYTADLCNTLVKSDKCCLDHNNAISIARVVTVSTSYITTQGEVLSSTVSLNVTQSRTVEWSLLTSWT